MIEKEHVEGKPPAQSLTSNYRGFSGAVALGRFAIPVFDLLNENLTVHRVVIDNQDAQPIERPEILTVCRLAGNALQRHGKTKCTSHTLLAFKADGAA